MIWASGMHFKIQLITNLWCAFKLEIVLNQIEIPCLWKRYNFESKYILRDNIHGHLDTSIEGTIFKWGKRKKINLNPRSNLKWPNFNINSFSCTQQWIKSISIFTNRLDCWYFRTYYTIPITLSYRHLHDGLCYYLEPVNSCIQLAYTKTRHTQKNL